MLRHLLVTATALAGVLAVPQDPVPAPPPAPQAPALQAPAPQPAAAPADVASVDAIVKAVYDVISGPAGAARDWNRMRSLFHPDARLVPVVGAGEAKRARLLTVDDYVRRSGPMLERDGFFEREIARTATTFGDITHVWSTYEGRRTADDPKPFCAASTRSSSCASRAAGSCCRSCGRAKPTAVRCPPSSCRPRTSRRSERNRGTCRTGRGPFDGRAEHGRSGHFGRSDAARDPIEQPRRRER